MGKLENTTTYALEERLMKSLRKKADELEEYKQTLELKTPTYDVSPEDSFEKPVQYERQVYYPKSTEEIKTTAENALQGDYDAGKQKIAGDLLTNLAKLEQKRNKQNDNRYDALNSLSRRYDELQTKKKAKMIDNGLSRSSIKEQVVGDLLNEGELKKRNVEEAFDKKDLAIADDIQNRKDEADTKMKEFQRKYEKELAKSIDSLTKEEQKKVDAASKHNEGLTEKELFERQVYEKNVQSEAARRKKEYEESLREYQRELNNAKEKNYRQRFYLAKDIYSTMPKEKAIQMMRSNTELYGLLGKRYYDLLIETIVGPKYYVE